MDEPFFEFVNYNVISKPFNDAAAIVSEAMTEKQFKAALYIGHGIRVEKGENPMLWFIQDSQQMEAWQDSNITPTMMQILCTCRIVDLSEIRAKERFETLLNSEDKS